MIAAKCIKREIGGTKPNKLAYVTKTTGSNLLLVRGQSGGATKREGYGRNKVDHKKDAMDEQKVEKVYRDHHSLHIEQAAREADLKFEKRQ